MARAPNELAEVDYMQGMKYKDIAAKYGVSINTVKSWKQRHKWNKKGVHTKAKKGCTQNSRDAPVREEDAKEVERIMENDNLTDKQKLFCIYYAKSFNATRAYMKAYQSSYNVANAEGYKLLVKPCVEKEIRRLKQGKLNKAMLEPEDVFQKYMDIAFADLTDYVEFGNEEIEADINGEIKEITISHVNIKNSDEVDGTIISEVSKGRDGIKVKLADRMKALDWLAAHMDLATEKQKAELELIKAKAAIESKGQDKEHKKVVIINDV